MHENDLNRVEFFSKEDFAGSQQLAKGENVLRNEIQSTYTDINDILELHNIKKYIDNELYLKSWTQLEIANFIQNVSKYGKVIGQFISSINDSNVIDLYDQTVRGYIKSFWELFSNQNVFKRISKNNFNAILSKEPHLIQIILTHKNLVDHYNVDLKNFLLTYSQSAEILISTYEVQENFRKVQKFIPKSLTVQDKENIISNYLDSNEVNLNYVGIIINARNKNDFKISDKTRLKAKRLQKKETEKIFEEKGNNSFLEYGVSISFPENASKVKEAFIENLVGNYSYSLDFIRQNNDSYSLFQNFKILFEYLDIQNRINLVSKRSQIGVMERVLGIHSHNEYRGGFTFNLSEMTSQAQIVSYSKILAELNNSLEDISHYIFTSSFQEKYAFSENARLSIPSATNSYFEKVRLLAPEFESVLKQFKLFVEDGNIDFELLQISSTPSTIKEIPSLNQNKYIYFNDNNKAMVGCSNLFFSDQTFLTYVEPFKEKKYHCFFDLVANEKVTFNNYEEHHKPELNYLIEKGFISIDNDGIIKIINLERIIILKDLYMNDVASFHRYPLNYQKEAIQMDIEEIISFESSLFSKPEQSYFSYFLNKSEFTNGLDLRNSYLHGTQASPDEVQKHEYAYFTYLKLLILTLLKMEDDLIISKST